MVWQASPNAVVTSLYNSSGNTVIGANSNTKPINLIDVSNFSSYDLNLSVFDTLQNTAGHALTIEIEVAWYDDTTSNIPVFRESWYPWVVSQQVVAGSLEGIVATGPMHGRYMTINITNNAGFAVTLQYFNLFGSARNVQLSDWRQCYGNHITDATQVEVATVGDGYDNVLFDSSGGFAVANSTGYACFLCLYSGPVNVEVLVISGAFSSIQVLDIGSNQENSGGITTNVGLIYGATASFNANIFLPRSGCVIKLVTTSTGAGSVSVKVTAQQGP